MDRSGALIVVLLCALLFRLAFAVRTPAWRSPDEYPHYWVMHQLQATGTLPVSSPAFPTYEAYQPPLYYCLGVLALLPWGGDLLPFTEELVAPPGPLLTLRLFSVLMGVVTVAATFLAVKRSGQGRAGETTQAALFAAVLTTFVSVSATANNDALVAMLSAIALSVVLLPARRWKASTGFFGGLWVGLAILTKSNGLVLIPVVILRLIQVTKGQRVDLWRWGAPMLPGIAVGIALVVWRNVVQYGEPVLVTPGVERAASFSAGQVAWALRNLGGSFWLALGRIYEIRPPVSIYLTIIMPMTLLGVLGWIRVFRKERDREISWLILVGIVSAVCASLLFTLSFPAGQQTSWGKNLYVVLPLLALLFVRGWRNVSRVDSGVLPWIGLALMVIGSVWGLLAVSRA